MIVKVYEGEEKKNEEENRMNRKGNNVKENIKCKKLKSCDYLQLVMQALLALSVPRGLSVTGCADSIEGLLPTRMAGCLDAI